MKWRVVGAVVAVAVVLVGFGLWRRATAGDTTPGTTTSQVESGGVWRTYLLDTPGGSAPAAGRPLLILLHGGGGTAESMDKQTGGLPALANAAGYVVARPQGLNKQWNDGREVNKDVDDVAFISAMVDDIATGQPIDRSRLYAAGISNGGFMSGRLACEANLGIAAIAQVAATLGVDTDAACDPGHPVSVLAILGRADPIVPYAGGPVRLPLDNSETGRGIVLGGQAYFLRWIQRNGAGAPVDGASIAPDAAAVVAKADSGAEVELVTVEGGGHAWPGGVQYLPKIVVGSVTDTFSASKLMLEFFERH